MKIKSLKKKKSKKKKFLVGVDIKKMQTDRLRETQKQWG